MAEISEFEEFRGYFVWDLQTRWFHWINALVVFGLIVVGIVLLNDDAFGISTSGKVLLKQIHATLGYIMAANLIWRFVWAFLGNRYARWQAMVPYGEGYWSALRSYGSAFIAGEPQQYIGHNPAGRVGVVLLLALLVLQAATGLVLAGTDLFWSPFGGYFAGWIVAPGINPASVSPLIPNSIDPAAFKEMRAFRSSFVFVHLYGFYALAAVILAHLVAVIATEVHEGGSLTSAMFTGRKILTRPPQDNE